MGNDGGSIPRRSELVKSAARTPTVSELKATALESLAHAWAFCPLTGEPLDLSSAVSDWQGRLYSYEAVLKGLIPSADDADSKEADKNDEHHAIGGATLTFADTGIRSLRDVVRLKFTKKEAAVAGGPDRKSTSATRTTTLWVCPLSLKELGPATRSVYLVPCGHVFAEAAIREIQDRDLTSCPECSEPLDPLNIVSVLPTEEKDVQRMLKRMEQLTRDGLTHSLKKDKRVNGEGSKKKKKRKGDEVEGEDKKTSEKASRDANGEGKQGGKLSGINNPMTASITAKVLAEQEEKSKRRKLAATGAS